MSGIVCKVWNISSVSHKKNSSSQITDSVKYIFDSEKTNGELKGEESEDFYKKQLGRECSYVENDVKTMDGAYIGCVNLSGTDIKKAVDEMIKVKEFYGKTDGRAALHGIISLPVEDSDVSKAGFLMRLCEDVLRELFPEHQAVFAVHTNTENLHVHFIVNSVGLNGKKIHQPKGFMENTVHPCINKYAEKYGFIKNDKWSEDKEKDSRNFWQIKSDLRNILDLAIENSADFDEFIDYLKDNGLSVNLGKHLSVKDDHMNKPIRTHQLGKLYTIDSIIERIELKKVSLLDFDRFYDPKTFDRSYQVYSANVNKLKKYSDMTDKEKKDTVKLLRKGVNPWRENKKLNWSLNRISDEINMVSRLHDLVREYSLDGSCVSALAEILNRKKELSSEKRETKDIFSKYKGLTDIYYSMKKIEKKAYLYEHDGRTEFRQEFEDYREYTRRLKDNYHRSVNEVAVFVRNYEDRILYFDKAIKELSHDYLDIKKFADKGYNLNGSMSLSDFLFSDFSHSSSLNADTRYYVSNTSPYYTVKVDRLPIVDEFGNTRQGFNLQLISEYGDVIESINDVTDYNDVKSFISSLEGFFGFSDCVCFENSFLSSEYVSLKSKSDNTDNSNSDRDSEVYTFTEAVNYYSSRHDTGEFYIFNSLNPGFYGIINTGKDIISINIYDSYHNPVDSFRIPSVDNKNTDGFNQLSDIKDRYGFNDRIVLFKDKDEALSSYNSFNRGISR